MRTLLISAGSFREWQERRARLPPPRAIGLQAESGPAREPPGDRVAPGPVREPRRHGAQGLPRGERLQAVGLERLDRGADDVEAAPVDERDLGTIADVDVDLVPRDVLRLPEHDDRPGRPDDRERRLESEARALELLGSPSGEALRSERGLLERMERARD